MIHRDAFQPLWFCDSVKLPLLVTQSPMPKKEESSRRSIFPVLHSFYKQGWVWYHPFSLSEKTESLRSSCSFVDYLVIGIWKEHKRFWYLLWCKYSSLGFLESVINVLTQLAISCFKRRVSQSIECDLALLIDKNPLKLFFPLSLFSFIKQVSF